MAQLWFVAAAGRGTALTAYVYGPYDSQAAFHQANPGTAGETFTLIGNKGGYTSKAAAKAEARRYNSSSVTSRVTQAGGHTAQSLGLDPTRALSGLSAIGDFFSRLTQANTWIRVGEVLLGLALLSVGFARITGTTPVIEKIAAGIPGAVS